MKERVIGLFLSYADADMALSKLIEKGFKSEDMDVLLRESVIKEYLPEHYGSTETGAAVGGLAGLFVGLATFAVPPVGLVYTVGAGLAALAATVTGAAAGGLIGSLVDYGLTEEVAEDYVNAIHKGGVMLAVSGSDKNAMSAKEAMLEAHAVRVEVAQGK